MNKVIFSALMVLSILGADQAGAAVISGIALRSSHSKLSPVIDVKCTKGTKTAKSACCSDNPPEWCK